MVGAASSAPAGSVSPARVVATGLAGPSADSLRGLGQWVATFPRASPELATDPCFSLAATGTGEAVLIWWRDGLLFTVMCEDRAALATVTAQHLACA